MVDDVDSIARKESQADSLFHCEQGLADLRDPARVIHNADARLLYRYFQSTKMVHAALLLEPVTTALVSTEHW
jgi:hypothetical protein